MDANRTGNTAQQPKPENIIARLLVRASHLLEFANENAHRSHQAADRAAGERPPAGEKPATDLKPVRSGEMGKLEDIFDDLEAALHAGQLGLNRISTII